MTISSLHCIGVLSNEGVTHWKLQEWRLLGFEDIKVRLVALRRELAADPDSEAMHRYVAQVI